MAFDYTVVIIYMLDDKIKVKKAVYLMVKKACLQHLFVHLSSFKHMLTSFWCVFSSIHAISRSTKTAAIASSISFMKSISRFTCPANSSNSGFMLNSNSSILLTPFVFSLISTSFNSSSEMQVFMNLSSFHSIVRIYTSI